MRHPWDKANPRYKANIAPYNNPAPAGPSPLVTTGYVTSYRLPGNDPSKWRGHPARSIGEMTAGGPHTMAFISLSCLGNLLSGGPGRPPDEKRRADARGGAGRRWRGAAVPERGAQHLRQGTHDVPARHLPGITRSRASSAHSAARFARHDGQSPISCRIIKHSHGTCR